MPQRSTQQRCDLASGKLWTTTIGYGRVSTGLLHHVSVSVRVVLILGEFTHIFPSKRTNPHKHARLSV